MIGGRQVVVEEKKSTSRGMLDFWLELARFTLFYYSNLIKESI